MFVFISRKFNQVSFSNLLAFDEKKTMSREMKMQSISQQLSLIGKTYSQHSQYFPISKLHPSGQNQVESQQNNIRGRCSNVIFLTFNSNLLAGMSGLTETII